MHSGFEAVFSQKSKPKLFTRRSYEHSCSFCHGFVRGKSIMQNGMKNDPKNPLVPLGRLPIAKEIASLLFFQPIFVHCDSASFLPCLRKALQDLHILLSPGCNTREKSRDVSKSTSIGY